MIWPVILLLACSGGEGQPPTHDHGDGKHDHGDGTTAHHHPDAGHASHDAMSDHMGVMSATRDRLRNELGLAYDEPVPGLAQADATRGKALYDQHCSSCHGAAGRGDGAAGAALDPKPADFTDSFHARYYSDAGRVRLVEQGSPGTGMPAFGGTLDSQQILDVYAFVRSLRGD